MAHLTEPIAPQPMSHSEALAGGSATRTDCVICTTQRTTFPTLLCTCERGTKWLAIRNEPSPMMSSAWPLTS
ncbi:hypothetical protein TSOC_006966 [Tetrabaena socialis]|uniref:Uncharacterized protein n=1 Tax=Tetrabaena socialis TaxID=47790 RepID=A0A2J8A2B3_9CHLO|nr:hypothetical protein TSOC_006966 [Tetrabaena socialis]|eukprot:PNH06659.1 hypothetical protein TSOC_006966 [Tetrabaena socialis]